jgi:hypothetical protein
MSHRALHDAEGRRVSMRPLFLLRPHTQAPGLPVLSSRAGEGGDHPPKPYDVLCSLAPNRKNDWILIVTVDH